MTNKQGVESNFVPYDRSKYRSRAQLQMIPADEPMTTISFDAVTNHLCLYTNFFYVNFFSQLSNKLT